MNSRVASRPGALARASRPVLARAAAALVVSGVCLLAAGCSTDETGSDETPQQFVDRAQLPSCGEVDLDQGAEIPAESLTCLEDAGDEGAELAVTRPTTEGDPIIEYYRVLPGGGWEAYIDATQDEFGGGWWYTECPDAEALVDLAKCEGSRL